MSEHAWPNCERVYGTEAGCDLPPHIESDGDSWPACIRCGFMFTRNFSGLCVPCRRVMSAQPRPADLQTGPQKSPRGDHHE